MNAVEIEEAVSALAGRPFESGEFPFSFLQAFGNKAATIKRLRSGASNRSDLGGVLQRSNIHIKVCPEGDAAATLGALKEISATALARAKFVLATDGMELHAEDLSSGDVIVCDYPDFPEHFGFFLPLAGITTVRQISDSAFDIRATGRLNRLYVELLKADPEWGAADRRPDMNHFMARLIFCFFAEDTDIFNGESRFTDTIERMSASDSSNTHEVIGEIFRAMNTDSNIDRTKLEKLIHRIFAPVRLDIEVEDRFGNPVVPREWFLVPLDAIDDAVEKVREGTITRYRYDAGSASLVARP